MRIDEKDCFFCSGEGKSPVTMCADIFRGSRHAGSVVEGDVNVADGLCVSSIWFKGIISREDSVKVDVLVSEDISPQAVWESGAIRSVNEHIFGMFDVGKIVSS